MKVQFVFFSLLVCSLLGELLGEGVEESDYVVLDNADATPDRRGALLDSGCVKVPMPEGKVFPHAMYPRRTSKYSSKKSSLAYGKVQFPRYQDNFVNLPSGGSNNFKNIPDFANFQYNGKRLSPHNNDFFENNGKGQRYPFKSMQNFGNEGAGPFMGADKGKRSGRVYMMSLRDKKGREVYRRMLDAADVEEEEEMEDPQDY
ncbi:hypothetical protein CBL_14453 [Carabus blaptoides fortunei]